jgi:hypothetical protein
MDCNQNCYILSTSSLMTKPTAKEAILENQLLLQRRCYQLLFQCSKLRINHPNIAVGLHYDDYIEHVMTHITDNSADAFQKLTWFNGQFTPLPATLPPGSVPLLPPHDPTAPGTSAQGTATGHRRSTAPKPKNRKRSRANTSTSTVLTPPPQPTLDVGCHNDSSGSEEGEHRVERIILHYWNGDFKRQGAGTSL